MWLWPKTVCLLYLVEVDDSEAVSLSFPHVPDAEKEPLSMLVGVEVKGQVQLVIPLPSAKKKNEFGS